MHRNVCIMHALKGTGRNQEPIMNTLPEASQRRTLQHFKRITGLSLGVGMEDYSLGLVTGPDPEVSVFAKFALVEAKKGNRMGYYLM